MGNRMFEFHITFAATQQQLTAAFIAAKHQAQGNTASNFRKIQTPEFTPWKTCSELPEYYISTILKTLTFHRKSVGEFFHHNFP